MNHPHESRPAVDVQTLDPGFREWYESCPCCMSKAYPEVKQALDAEKAEASHAHDAVDST
jgi:hypothetical protein